MHLKTIAKIGKGMELIQVHHASEERCILCSIMKLLSQFKLQGRFEEQISKFRHYPNKVRIRAKKVYECTMEPWKSALRENCPYTEFFLSIFPHWD